MALLRLAARQGDVLLRYRPTPQGDLWHATIRLSSRRHCPGTGVSLERALERALDERRRVSPVAG